MKILALDTATENLSVALYADGALVLRQARPVRGHGEWLLPMVEDVLGEAGLALGDLDAIAVGRGPGAFTGVRIAVSVAQGLAFAAGLPIVGVSDLAALALGAAQRLAGEGPVSAPLTILSCLDARLGGLYAAAFRLPAGTLDITDAAHYLSPVEALTTPAALALAGDEPILVAGHGWSVSEELPRRVGARLLRAYPDLLPSAASIASLAAILLPAGHGVAPEALAPVYLRDDVATRSTRAPGAPR